jgi:hypothetical protein
MKAILFVLLFISINVLKAQENKAFSNFNIGFYSGINFYKADNIKGDFLVELKTNLLSSLKLKASAGVLDSLIYISTNGDRSRIAYNYNDDLSLNYLTNAVWINGKWNISERHTNSYNSDKNLESVLWELFNSTAEEWYQSEKDIFGYDSSKNRIFSLHQYFSGREFVNEFKNEDYYDAANNLVLSVSKAWVDSMWWVNSHKTIIIFNSDNLIDTTLLQSWSNSQWVNSQKNIYEYDKKNNIAVNKTIRWLENKWTDYAQGSFTYDKNDNCILEAWMIANGNNLENWSRIFYEYDDNNNLIHLYGEEWENGEWIPGNELLKVTNPDGILFGYLDKEIFLYYSKPTSVESEKIVSNGFNLVQNYPNPFNPSTTIKYNLPKEGKVAIRVYDILGREVITLVNEYKQAGNYIVTWNGKDAFGSEVSSGVYFYNIRYNEQSLTKKMMLIR